LCQGLVDTVIFHVNAVTGGDALGKSPAGTVLQGVDLISGPSLGAYQLSGHSKAVIVLDEFRQVRFGPDFLPFSFAYSNLRSMFTLGH